MTTTRGTSGARMTAQDAAEAAVDAVGCGYDLTGDLRLGRAKPGGRLVDLDAARPGPSPRDLAFPGGAVVAGVPGGVVADKGERARFRSDVLPFAQMAEQVNVAVTGGQDPLRHLQCHVRLPWLLASRRRRHAQPLLRRPPR